MKRDHLIIILAFVGAGVIFYIAMFGISGQVTLRSGICEQAYTHYYVEPFLGNIMQCMYMTPCGTHQGLTIRNAKIDIIQCLCKDRIDNAEAIVRMMKEARADYPLGSSQSTDANQICDNEAREFGLL